MNTKLLSLSLLASLRLSIAHAESTDPLWNQAVQIASASRDWIAGEVRTVEQELSRKGDVKNSQETLSLVSQNPDGKIEMKHWRIEKGRRIPHVPEGEEETPGNSSVSFGPLDLENQSLVHIKRLSDFSLVGGIFCIQYEYELKTTESPDQTLRGVVRINESNGIPIELTMVPNPLPDSVKSLTMTLTFSSPDAQTIRPATMTTDVSASVLLMTQQVRVIQEFSAFWLLPRDKTKDQNSAPSTPK